MGVRNINLHQISGNSINAFLSLCHQFYRPIIRMSPMSPVLWVYYNPKAHAPNLKLRNMYKLETAFDYRRYFFLDLFSLSL